MVFGQNYKSWFWYLNEFLFKFWEIFQHVILIACVYCIFVLQQYFWIQIIVEGDKVCWITINSATTMMILNDGVIKTRKRVINWMRTHWMTKNSWSNDSWLDTHWTSKWRQWRKSYKRMKWLTKTQWMQFVLFWCWLIQYDRIHYDAIPALPIYAQSNKIKSSNARCKCGACLWSRAKFVSFQMDVAIISFPTLLLFSVCRETWTYKWIEPKLLWSRWGREQTCCLSFHP